MPSRRRSAPVPGCTPWTISAPGTPACRPTKWDRRPPPAAAGRRLQTARILVAAALGLLLIGVLLTWWAPAAPTNPPAYLKVTRPGGTVCGSLNSADSGNLRLTVTGAFEPVVIPLTNITNRAITPTCP